jgi:hypothetical protein
VPLENSFVSEGHFVLSGRGRSFETSAEDPRFPNQVADGIAAALTAKLFGTSGVHVMVNPSAEEIDPGQSIIQLRRSS